MIVYLIFFDLDTHRFYLPRLLENPRNPQQHPKAFRPSFLTRIPPRSPLHLALLWLVFSSLS
jgi:hypothetical protein